MPGAQLKQLKIAQALNDKASKLFYNGHRRAVAPCKAITRSEEVNCFTIDPDPVFIP